MRSSGYPDKARGVFSSQHAVFRSVGRVLWGRVLRQVLAPIHPDGWKFVAIGAVVTLVLWLLWGPLGWLALIVTLWIAYFFRDPWRVTPTRAGLIISPADGIVVSVAPAPPPPELDMGNEPVPRDHSPARPFPL